MYIKFIFSGFFIFLGHLIIFAMILHVFWNIVDTFISNLTIWLRGYPKRTIADEMLGKAILKAKEEQRN